MRTHRIVFECAESTDSDKAMDIINQYFCDWTHWFCGLDGAGEDTPEKCIIYRGIIHPEIITVEFDPIYMFPSVDAAVHALTLMFDHWKNCKKPVIKSYKIEKNDYIGV